MRACRAHSLRALKTNESLEEWHTHANSSVSLPWTTGQPYQTFHLTSPLLLREYQVDNTFSLPQRQKGLQRFWGTRSKNRDPQSILMSPCTKCKYPADWRSADSTPDSTACWEFRYHQFTSWDICKISLYSWLRPSLALGYYLQNYLENLQAWPTRENRNCYRIGALTGQESINSHARTSAVLLARLSGSLHSRPSSLLRIVTVALYGWD